MFFTLFGRKIRTLAKMQNVSRIMYFPATMKGFIRKFIPSGNGVERTEKICVGSGIGYVSLDQDWLRVRFTRCELENSSIFLASFNGIWRVVANWLIGQQISGAMKTVLIKKMAQLIWKKTSIPDIRTLALNRVGYLGLGFAHLLPNNVCGLGVRSTH